MEGSVPPKPRRARDFLGPVGWLLSRQLLVALKHIALSSAYGDKLDHRDWMRADIHSFTASDEEPFWFDYIADCGDGQLPTYDIAYVALRDLQVSATTPNATVSFASSAVRGGITLPRGSFLFVGGDTAYHIADYPTLAERFWAPFRWACDEVPGQLARRPLFAIPGNHDHYDSLHGFNRQFRRSLGRVGTNSRFDASIPARPLDIPAFERCQETSYVALSLPFDWWLWGLDTQPARGSFGLDFRQRHFFERVMAGTGGRPPKKLIIATPQPTTKFGKRPRYSDKAVRPFSSLGLACPFLDRGNGEPPSPLAEDCVRLDLAGDIHHYARYGGPARSDQPANYASVVSGLGGAFLHPSHTDFGEVRPQVLYPDKAHSRATVASRLFRPWTIWRGGLIWLVGGLVALVMTYAARVPTTHAVLSDLLARVSASARSAFDAIQVQPGDLVLVPGSVEDGVGIMYWRWLGAFALVVAFAYGYPAWRAWRRPYREFTTALAFARPHLATYLGVLLGTALIANMPQVEPRGPRAAYTASILLLASSATLAVSFVWSSLYSDALAQQAKIRRIRTREYAPVWVVLIFGAFTVMTAHWRNGQVAIAIVAWDVLFTMVLVLCTIGLGGVAAFVGAKHHRWRGRIGFFLIGLWHALLQISLPVVFVTITPAVNAVLGLLLLVPAGFVGQRVARDDRPWLLLALWIIVGVVVLGLAIAAPTPRPLTATGLVVAFALGAGLGCTWSGWFLAVSLAFEGHNNECGGAARIVQFKQLMRIKLTRDCLTAYVIAFDEPAVDAERLELRLLDVFELRPMSNVGGAMSTRASAHDAP